MRADVFITIAFVGIVAFVLLLAVFVGVPHARRQDARTRGSR